MEPRSKHIHEFGPFRLIPAERQLLRDNQPVQLTPKAFDLLVVLVENSGHLMEKGELMRRLWPDTFVEEANLTINVSALRRALGAGKYLETVPRSGYRFIADVSSVAAIDDAVSAAPENQRAETPVVSNQPASGFWRFRWHAAGAVFAVLLIMTVALNVGGIRQRFSRHKERNRFNSIAVLPLENLSGDATQDYFAEGMTETLTTDLARIVTIRVMARSSVTPYKSTPKPVREIGRELNVEAVLTGSVARSGERVRIAVQLVDVATQQNIWANSYDRDLRDVLTLQSEVARDVVNQLSNKLSPQTDIRSTRVQSLNPEAYDAYLRGRFFLNRQTKEDNDLAIAALEHAVSVDPSFAAAHAQLAQAYVWKLFLFAPDQKEWNEKAFVETEKALELDPDSAVAHLARGRLLWTPANHFPHDKAIREYQRALSIDPTLDEARNQLALVYCHVGFFEEALAQSRQAITTNPNNNLAQLRIGQTLNFQGKYGEALEVLRAIPQQTNPSLLGHQIAWSLFNLGKRDEASALLEQLLKDQKEDTGGVFTSVQAVVAASAGQQQLSEEKIKSAIQKGKGFGHFHHTAYHIACAYARLKKIDEAIKWLEIAADDGFPCYPLFQSDTNLDNLRQDPKFADFLARLRERWESYQKSS